MGRINQKDFHIISNFTCLPAGRDLGFQIEILNFEL
jgi:hypothetical protein